MDVVVHVSPLNAHTLNCAVICTVSGLNCE